MLFHGMLSKLMGIICFEYGKRIQVARREELKDQTTLNRLCKVISLPDGTSKIGAKTSLINEEMQASQVPSRGTTWQNIN